MKLLYTTIAFLFIQSFCYAQSNSKVTWQNSIKKIGDNEYEVHLTATLQPGWHLYSQTQPEGAIALPTTITFTKNPLLTFSGKTNEKGKVYDQYDKATASRSRYYASTVDFVQVVRLKGNVKTVVSGEVEYMVCDDKQCLPPSNFKFSLKL